MRQAPGMFEESLARPKARHEFPQILRRGLRCFGVFAYLAALSPSAEGQEQLPPMVHVHGGRLRGTSSDGVDRFLAIPYAAPPVAERRWKPPAAPAAWQGLRSADALPPRCAQIGSEGPGDEDCLYLNIYRPAHPHRSGRLPVLFYIHGGSLKVGASIDNDPSRIAAGTDTIVVMINYRLGPFGFLAHPAIGAETPDRSSGEYGLMDQQAALRWVHEEISAFGGDPHNVTIAGFSAGGVSVCAHMVSAPVAGLFSGAVIQSGGCYATPLAEAEASGIDFAKAAGCPETDSAACLRQKSTAELLAVDSWSYANPLVWGGRLLREDPAVSVAAGRFARVPVMIGNSREEARAGLSANYPMTTDDYTAFVNEAFGAKTQAVMDAYPVGATYSQPFDALSAILSDSGGMGGVCASRQLALAFARHVATYMYEFDDPSAPVPTWVTLGVGEEYGASHGSDEAYWFDRPLDTIKPLDAAQGSLAHQMIQYLGAFVERGAPRAPREPYWPVFEDKRERVLRFQPMAVRLFTDFSNEHRCDFWSSIGF